MMFKMVASISLMVMSIVVCESTSFMRRRLGAKSIQAELKTLAGEIAPLLKKKFHCYLFSEGTKKLEGLLARRESLMIKLIPLLNLASRSMPQKIEVDTWVTFPLSKLAGFQSSEKEHAVARVTAIRRNYNKTYDLVVGGKAIVIEGPLKRQGPLNIIKIEGQYVTLCKRSNGKGPTLIF